MDVQRIGAVALRHLRLFKHDVSRVLMVLFWPLLDIFIWGFLGTWMQKEQGTGNLQTAFLLSILLWQITNRISQEMAVGLLEEIWHENLANFFATPLKMSEWILGLICFSSILNLAVVTYGIVVINALYGVPFAPLISNVLIFGPSLMLCGILLGIFTISLIFYFGKKGQEIAFISTWICTPFCAVFYPREVLPPLVQKIGGFLPMTYIFEGMRGRILRGEDPTLFIGKSLMLTAGYLGCALFLFTVMFTYSKNKGLSRLND